MAVVMATLVLASGCGVGRSLVEPSAGDAGTELPGVPADVVAIPDRSPDAVAPQDYSPVEDSVTPGDAPFPADGVLDAGVDGVSVDGQAPDGPCEPVCEAGTCGGNGCGGLCECPVGEMCVFGKCTPKEGPCKEKQCGPDGAGGSCGECAAGEVCADGLCVVSVGPNDCKGVFDCFETCPEGDQACYQSCVDGADADGQKLYYEVMQCLSDTGYFECPPNDDTCYGETFEPCKVVYYQCVQGEGTCMDMYSCMYDCPSGGPESEQCYNDCYFQGSFEALMQWDEWNTCLSETGYYDCQQWDQECLDKAWEPCSLPFKECVHGALKCAGVMGCFADCPQMMEECWFQCYYNGTVEAQLLYEELLACVQGQCGQNPKPMCRNQAMKGTCAPQAKECKGS